MKIKRIITTLALTLLCCLVSVSPSYAARIYNELNVPVVVGGSDSFLDFAGRLTSHFDEIKDVSELLNFAAGEFRHTTRIDSGTRSESLEWDGDNYVSASVYEDNQPIEACNLNFGFHNQIVGGNYMLIRPSGSRSADCVVCDSNHQVIQGNGSC